VGFDLQVEHMLQLPDKGLDSLDHVVHAVNKGGTVSMVRCILGLNRQ